MKKLVLFISVLFIACACSSLEYERETSPPHANVVTKSTFSLKSSDNLFFHPQSGLYISMNRDAIDFFESASVNSIQPTHIAVKFFPKDEEEKRTILGLDGVHVSYIPFGYDPVDPDAYEADGLGQVKIFTETEAKIKTVTISSDDLADPVNPKVVLPFSYTESLSLPVMYVTMPIDVQYPTEIEHEIVYRFPMENVLENINRAQQPQSGFTLKLQTYDAFLSSYVPLRSVQIVLSYNGFDTSVYTNGNGCAEIDPMLYNSSGHEFEVGVRYVMENSKWTISRDDNSTPISGYLGTVGELLGYDLNVFNVTKNLTSSTNEWEVHRAVDHYHNSSHALSSGTTSNEYGVTIHVKSNSDLGSYGYTQYWDKSIYIFNNGQPKQKLISTVFHELGHIRQSWNCSFDYDSRERIVSESYASYIGWYLGEHYYLSKGYVKSSESEQINQQGRQYWLGSNDYSPFFVDLNDRFNQSSVSNSYINEGIEDVPHSVLDQVAKSCGTMSACAAYLRSLAGSYYTLEEINDYLSYYNQ